MAFDNTKWFHLNRYNALAACEHCRGIIRHEPWCMLVAPIVSYAYEIVTDPSKLTVGDALMLHALGVAWDETKVGEPLPDTCPGVDLMLEMANFGMACRA